MRYYPRPALVAAILQDPALIIVIEGPAGTGKTSLLREIQASAPHRQVWDVAQDGDRLPEGPVILAKRPNVQVAGLARAAIYGKVSVYGAEHLLFENADFLALGLSVAASEQLMAQSGGWACLLRPVAEGWEAEQLVQFLAQEVLADISPAQVPLLQAYLEGKIKASSQLRDFAFYLEGEIAPVLQRLKGPLCEALAQKTQRFTEEIVSAKVLARAQQRLGEFPAAIATLQKRGLWQQAALALEEGGGNYFVHRFGIEALDAALAGFPKEQMLSNEILVQARAISAVKHGEVRLAIHILKSYYGPAVLEAQSFIQSERKFSLSARMCRILMTTWEESVAGDGYLEAAYGVLAELPIEDHLRRGSFYNSILDDYIRKRRFAEAQLVAAQAARHFDMVGVANLSFFITLHQALISLHLGQPLRAREYLEQAEQHQNQAPESTHIRLLLRLVGGAVGYELGAPDDILAFVEHDLDMFVQGEVWSAIVDLLLSYGSLALLKSRGLQAARGLLERWRALGWQPRNLAPLLQTRELVLLQHTRRWHEARLLGSALWADEPSLHDLEHLDGRDQITLLLCQMRQELHQAPQSEALPKRLAVLEENPHLLARQRHAVRLWRVMALLRQRRSGEAEALLLQVLQTIAQSGARAILWEEADVLEAILRAPALREAVERQDALRALIQKPAILDLQSQGVTRQEARVAQAILEGASNKEIANFLGVSSATVKFHLANLYRKFSCTGRRELRESLRRKGFAP